VITATKRGLLRLDRIIKRPQIRCGRREPAGNLSTHPVGIRGRPSKRSSESSPKRTSKKPTLSYSYFAIGTTSTGHAAPRRILSVTLAISMRDRPLQPCDDMTTRSIRSLSAHSIIAL